LTKSLGERLRKCGAGQVGPTLAAELSPEIRAAVVPLLAEVEALNQRVAAYDRQIEQLAKEHYPEVARLQQVKGVGTLIALTFVLNGGRPEPLPAKPGRGLLHGPTPRRRNSGKIRRGWQEGSIRRLGGPAPTSPILAARTVVPGLEDSHLQQG
jgi:transposase